MSLEPRDIESLLLRGCDHKSEAATSRGNRTACVRFDVHGFAPDNWTSSPSTCKDSWRGSTQGILESTACVREIDGKATVEWLRPDGQVLWIRGDKDSHQGEKTQ